VATLRRADDALEALSGAELLRIEPWGADSVRVRVARHRVLDDLPGALLPAKPANAAITLTDRHGELVNGDLTAVVEIADGEDEIEVNVSFLRTSDRTPLLAEQRAHFWWPGARLFADTRHGHARLEQRFRSYPGERLYGLGQRTHGRLNQKGMVLDLVQRNAEVNIPFVLSDRGYGLLWNSPAVGRVEFAENGTRWVADAARQIDYWITTGTGPADILRHYADATGHTPPLPEWASGFWQSKLRYRSQRELLDVVHEHKRRGLPLSVVVVDFFHWTHLGDWKFDRTDWPDPAGLVRELDALGVKLLVSVWPSVSPLSENYAELAGNGYLVDAQQGVNFQASWFDKGFGTKMPVAFYDATNPDARAFVWSKIKENYFDIGVRAFWLDACEPEIQPGDHGNLSFHAGPGAEVANLYPVANARTFQEGARDAGDEQVVLLCRSAWAGAQRHGAAVWSGDVGATWESLRAQVRAGLNVAISGIPWWTSDIGGFHGGDPESAGYRELMVRWFEFGALCPLFRLHGFRDPRTPFGPGMTGGPNEVWSYGEEAYGHIARLLEFRERLRPYLHAHLTVAHETGVPPMRPLFVDFPDDAAAWDVEDEFMLGPDLLVAPVLEAGAREREVWLPAGADWVDIATGTELGGGRLARVAAPLGRPPLFARAGRDLPVRW
jgi:alpha-D-xyloside xylohydrolase